MICIAGHYPTHTCSKGLSNHVDALSVWPFFQQEMLKQLKYVLVRFEKGAITTFELFLKVITLIA